MDEARTLRTRWRKRAYPLSPVDLIPDFIPVLGYLDDLVLVPLGLALVIRLIPSEILREHRDRAKGAGFPSGHADL